MYSPIRIYIYVYLLNKSMFFLVGNDVSYNFNISDSLLSLRGKGSTAVQSRLGYLLSRPMSNSTEYTTSASMLNILIQHKNEEYDWSVSRN
jgi:hypothetical protein